MNTEVKELWVNALRSGDYVQGRGQLAVVLDAVGDDKTPNRKHCCLGVLCDIAASRGIVTTRYVTPEVDSPVDAVTIIKYNDEAGSLPPAVIQWAGITGTTFNDDPLVCTDGHKDQDNCDDDCHRKTLTILNDEDRATFTTIARYIEDQL